MTVDHPLMLEYLVDFELVLDKLTSLLVGMQVEVDHLDCHLQFVGDSVAFVDLPVDAHPDEGAGGVLVVSDFALLLKLDSAECAHQSNIMINLRSG